MGSSNIRFSIFRDFQLDFARLLRRFGFGHTRARGGCGQYHTLAPFPGSAKTIAQPLRPPPPSLPTNRCACRALHTLGFRGNFTLGVLKVGYLALVSRGGFCVNFFATRWAPSF